MVASRVGTTLLAVTVSALRQQSSLNWWEVESLNMSMPATRNMPTSTPFQGFGSAGYMCSGHDIKDGGKVWEVGQCLALCHGEPGCKAWNWNNGTDGHCWLKYQCDTFEVNPAVITGWVPTQCQSQDGVMCNDDGKNIKDVGVVVDEDACCAKCFAEPQCKAWNWNKGTDRHCWLKSSCETPVSNSAVVTGWVGPAQGKTKSDFSVHECARQCPSGTKSITDPLACVTAQTIFSAPSAGCWGQSWLSVIAEGVGNGWPYGCATYGAEGGGCGLTINKYFSSGSVCGDGYSTSVICENV